MRLPIMLALAALLAGCGSSDEDAAKAESEARAAKAARVAYEGEILAWRDQRAANLKRPDGWLSLVGLHWIRPGSTYIGTARDNGTRLEIGPPQIGMLSLARDGGLTLDIAAGAEITIDGEPAQGRVDLQSDADGPPTVVGFNRGDASFVVIKRGDRHALRVRNAMARTRTAFPGLDYFDIDPGFRFVAGFEAHAPGKTLDIVNMQGMVEAMPNPGRVMFEKDGQSYSLEAVDEGDGRLFLILADRTSGHETYAASRFLYADPPGSEGTTVVDFNKAYNPPCAFTDYSTCPMPPPENRLDLAIRAGEKKPLPYPQ